MPAAIEPFDPPRPFGEHVLLAELGRGACARVVAARGVSRFGPLYAIKVLHPGVAPDAPLSRMFRDEARIAQSVRGEFLIHALGVADEPSPHLVMPIVIGDALRGLLGSIPLAPALAARIGMDLCAGLESLHDVERLGNVAHRDVCPENVLVGVDGRARISDYGIAKIDEWTRSAVSRTGSAKGRMAYMAPEQLRSESVDARADVFAVACTVWEMLMGRQLFGGASIAEVAGNVLFAAVPAVSGRRSDVTPGLDGLLAAGLARDRGVRLSSPGEFAERLASVMPPSSREELGAFVSARAPGRVEVLQRLRRDSLLESVPKPVVP